MKITQIPAQKLDTQDFNLMEKIGRNVYDSELKRKVTEFFWNIIIDSDNCNEEILKICVPKFAELVKNWSLDQKKPIFDRFPEQLKNTENSILPLLSLFRKLIFDEIDKKKMSVYYGGN